MKWGGRSLDLVVDRAEALTGLIEDMPPEEVMVNWTQNRWFITASRDSMQHDFYHYFFHKIHEQKQRLSQSDMAVYALIKNE